MKTCIIRQPAGLGDIFFIQKIAKNLLNIGRSDQIIWPVIREYNYLKDYMIGENILYVNEEESFPFKDVYMKDPQEIIDTPELLYLPIQHADRFIDNCPIMQRKYKFVNIPYDDWKKFFDYKRNFDRENYLISYLNLNIDEPFNLINSNFGSKNYAYLKHKIDIKINNGFRNIVMEYLDFDNIFDWTGILEKAFEIHTVDTAWCYLLEKMGKQKVTVYSRIKNENFFSYVRGIFNMEWIYIL